MRASKSPNVDELVEMLLLSCNGPLKPIASDSFTCTRQDNTKYVLKPTRVLDRIASCWFDTPGKKTPLSADLRNRVEALPWFKTWLETSGKRREVAKMRAAVTKADKLALIAQFYDGDNPPSWSDVIPLNLEDGQIFDFKPATLLDDLINNWLVGPSPGVVLTPEQMAHLETLPWLEGWVDRVRQRRARKRERTATATATATAELLQAPVVVLATAVAV